MNAVNNMEYNLRPQWRQWTYTPRHQPTCGRCGLTHFMTYCFASDRKCFKCHKIGHYGRVCYTQKQTQTLSSSGNTNRTKSKGKKQRDLRRISEYLVRKNIMRDMPFSSLRPAAFQEIVKNCNVQHIELNVVKQKFEMCQKVQKQQIKKLLENLQTSVLENERLQKELSEFQSREEEMKRKLSTCENSNMELKQNLESVSKREQEANEKLSQSENSKAVGNIQQYITQIQDLHTELQSKQSFIEFLTERYHEMQSEYQEKVETEKENTQKEKCLREATEQAYRDKFQELEATVNHKMDLLEQQSHPRHQNRNFDYRPNHRNFRGRGRFY